VSLIERLDWDCSFFGLPIGRVNSGVGVSDLGKVVSEAEDRGLRCLYLLVSAENTALLGAAEDHGFRVREIRVELQRPVVGHPAAMTGLRVGGAKDLEALERIARDRIRGTRFFADEHFALENSAELYVEWLRRGLIGGAPERQTLVGGADQGFVVCHLDAASGVGRIELIAVAKDAAGKGLGKALMAGAGALFNAASMVTAMVVTQGSNISAQALYQACGYRTAKVSYWLHIWL
jgi:ribosomal protein S18 acetylase RimI-like enzyme